MYLQCNVPQDSLLRLLDCGEPRAPRVERKNGVRREK